MRYELNHKGEIVEYDGDSQRLDNPKDTILKLFSQNNFQSEIIDIDGSVYKVKITSILGSSEIYNVYYGNIRNENRNPKEKKIQLGNKDPRKSGENTIILGIYCYNSGDDVKDLICAAWDVQDELNYPGNISIRGINIDLFQEAKINGFSTNEYRNKEVCAFRPEFIFYYLENRKQHHKTEKDEILVPKFDGKIIQEIIYGAPGTGKSFYVDGKVKEYSKNTERVTFHPEFDYISFVGGYKPAMNEKDEIVYKFVPQSFTNIYIDAWNNLANTAEDKRESYFLVIEEINRGNCAEIFGDIFQLLDRESEYEITPSEELFKYLSKNLDDKDFGLRNNKMLLPSNLNILATMNTSDQSLFPMDSAFKRRWDWNYIPINYNRDASQNRSANFFVKLDDKISFKWLDFIEKTNKIITNNENLGMDKCIGNYFINPEGDEISLNQFVNKALFYLWNDVFKDELEDESIFPKGVTYEDLFPIQANGVKNLKLILEKVKILKSSKELTSLDEIVETN